MTLLPIIYTSLLIFSAFLLFVIIVSYISYKTKSRDRVPVHLRHPNPLANRLVVQPITANNFRSAPVIQIKTAPYIQPKIQTHEQIRFENRNDIYTKAIETIKSRSENNTIQKEYSNETYARAIRKEKRSTRFENTQSVSDRLEIMNHSDKFKTPMQDSVPKNKSHVHYSNHADVNLFTFYSDQPDLNFVALSAPQINRAI